MFGTHRAARESARRIRTGGSGKVGGAAAGFKRFTLRGNSTGDKMVPGNTVYVRGAGSSFPGSADYTVTGYLNQIVEGDATSGPIKFVGENGRPRIDVNGLFAFDATMCWFEQIYFRATGTNILEQYGFLQGDMMVVYNNVFDLNDQAGTALLGTIGASNSNLIIFNEIFSKASAPTARSQAKGINIVNSYGNYIAYNHIHHLGDAGIKVADTSSNAVIGNNLIHHCKSDGILLAGNRGDIQTVIENNTIDANEGHGISITAATSVKHSRIVNNILSNHTGSGKYGLSVSGTTAANDLLKNIVDYNAFYNNTGHRNGISAGANDQTGVNPSYTAANDYRIGAALKALGFPTGDFLEAASGARTFLDIGALQRMERSARATFQLGM
jgi:hypothetical protein